MIQDIYPKIFTNGYQTTKPNDEDYILVFKGNEVLIDLKDETIIFPKKKDIGNYHYQYLFSISNDHYYLLMEDIDVEIDNFHFESVRCFRQEKPRDISFAGMTAYQLANWYFNNRYCGRCGNKTIIGTNERVIICESCHNMIYPKIMPAVIIGVTNGDKIVVSSYKDRPVNRALLAGFCEIGETLEDTVRREVKEEVGLDVKNISYFKSQPWGIDSDLLMGFFCEVDGDSEIKHIDENELSVAMWVSRDEIDWNPTGVSLTSTMQKYFKEFGYDKNRD